MGSLGTFLCGPGAGDIGLGVVSWLVSTCCAEETADEAEPREEE